MIVPCTFIGTCRAAPQRLFDDRPLERALEMETRVGHGVVRQQKVHLAPEQGADRAVDDRRAGEVAPGGLDARLIGRVVVAALEEHTDIEMIVRDDMGDLRRD